MFNTLSMDSAAPVGSVALMSGARLLSQDRFHGAEGHAVLLPLAVTRLLTLASFSCADLELIVVTNGPGSFSGLRIALGYAKGIALAQGTPMVGISTLDLLAAGAGSSQGWLSVVMDARRGEIFAALFRMEEGVPHRYSTPGAALSPEQWVATLANVPQLQKEPLHWTGSGLNLYGTLFQEKWPFPFATTPESTWVADPFLLGRLGQQFFLRHPSGTSAQDLPTGFCPEVTTLDYQRRPDAEIKK